MLVAAAMLLNTTTNRYHPIIYQDNPLPGPIEDQKARRLKSKMHHTGGFDTFAEAVESVDSHPALQEIQIKQWEPVLEWDGEGIPADVCFISDQKLVWL